MAIKKTHREWYFASIRLVPMAVLAIIGAYLASTHSNPRPSTIQEGVLVILGVILFLVTSISFLNVFANTFNKVLGMRMGIGRASMFKFIIKLIGYIIIGLVLLSSIHISVTNLLLGTAIIGIILGAAAQQTLGNFFASIVIVVDRPFSVGQNITINSGALGGTYTGTVMDISFSHTRLRLEDNSTVRLPNASLLSGAAVILPPRAPAQDKQANKN